MLWHDASPLYAAGFYYSFAAVVLVLGISYITASMVVFFVIWGRL